MSDYQEVRTTKYEPGQQQRAKTQKITQIIWLVMGVLEGLLALRVIFKLIGVNAANSFAVLLYGITGFFVAPFASLASAPSAGNIVFEVSTLIAMAVYLLVAWALLRIAYVIFYRQHGPVTVSQTVETDHTPQAGSIEMHRVSRSTATTETVPDRSRSTSEDTTHGQTPG